MVLYGSAKLKGFTEYGTVCISKILLPDKMDKVNEVVADCKKKNNVARVTDVAERQPRFVINMAIIRDADRQPRSSQEPVNSR
jgi:hypothetical protein